MIKWLKSEVRNIKAHDPAARSSLAILLLYPGLRAIIYHKLSAWLYNKGVRFIAMWLCYRCRRVTGIEIHPAAKIGNHVFIDHGMGVVIGETAEVGDGCTIYQGVTLGGTGKDTGKRHPTIGRNVLIGSGAKVLGAFTVGDNAKIAANAVVLCEVPPGATCVGIPARVIERKKPRPAIDLDQTHIPDPVAIELCKLLARIEKLEKSEKPKNPDKHIDSASESV